MKVPITRSFRIPIMECASKEIKFRQHLLTGAVNALLAASKKGAWSCILTFPIDIKIQDLPPNYLTPNYR